MKSSYEANFKKCCKEYAKTDKDFCFVHIPDGIRMSRGFKAVPGDAMPGDFFIGRKGKGYFIEIKGASLTNGGIKMSSDPDCKFNGFKKSQHEKMLEMEAAGFSVVYLFIMFKFKVSFIVKVGEFDEIMKNSNGEVRVNKEFFLRHGIEVGTAKDISIPKILKWSD